MHHLFPTLLYPIRKERRLSILFLYLLINVVCNFLLAKFVCTTSFSSHFILQVCTTRNPQAWVYPWATCLCLVSLSYALSCVSVLCSVLCLCLPVTVHISPLPYPGHCLLYHHPGLYVCMTVRLCVYVFSYRS